ncbi:MAG: hypothetical protein ABIP90_04695 [Vicinamibacterales bacterium]
MERIPLHVEATADPARRGAVESGLDFHAAIEVDGTIAKLVLPKRFEGQRPQGLALLRKHGRDLPFRRAMNAPVPPMGAPAISLFA